MSTEVKTQLLSEKTTKAIDHWLEKFPVDQRRSALLAALHIMQEENDGHLTQELLDAVADYLQIPRIAAYEVATFYSMYEFEPVGKHKICVCTNISCMLNGSEEIVSHLKEKLAIDFGETTKDGRFTLKEVECLGACVNAPMMQVNKDYHERLTTEKVDQILEGME